MNTKALVEGALLAGVTVLLALLGNVLPVVPLFLPVPIVLIAMHHGSRMALLTVVVAGLLLAFTMGPSAALIETIAFGSAGLAIGFGAHRKWPAMRTLVLTAVVSTIATFALLALTFYILGINQVDQVAQALIEATKITRNLMQQSPLLNTPQAQTQVAQMELMVDLFRRSWWAIFIATAIFSAIMQYAVVRWTLLRLRLDMPPVPAFSTWKAPSEAALILAVALGLQLVGQPVLKTIGEGLYLLLIYLYFVTGLALVYGLLRRYGIGKPAAIIVAALLSMTLGPAVAIAGFIDSLMDFRLWLESRE